MTPEERASKIVVGFSADTCDADCIKEIAEAIREAEQAEREAVAKMVEELFPSTNGPGWLSQDIRHDLALSIAAAIRARSNP